MALWKPFRGSRTTLDTVEKHDGYVYFCIDDGSLFFDYIDADGNLQRKQINAKDAETLTGVTLEQIKTSISWNDLIDKPIDISNSGTLMWNGDRTGKEVASDMYFKISDATPTISELNSGYSMMLSFGDTYSTDKNNCITQDVGSGIVTLSGDIGIPFVVIAYDTQTDIPSGTYLINTNAVIDGGYHLTTLTINGYNGFTKETIRENYIPDTIARKSDIPEGSEQVQSDWSVNDETNPAYVKNRPFYVTDAIETSILDEVTYTKADLMEFDHILYHEVSLNLDLVENTEYIITINGTCYISTPKNHNGILYFGNYNMEDDSVASSGEAYCITESYFDVYNDENVAESYTIQITAMMAQYIQIDKRFVQYKPGEVLPVGETRNIYLNSTQENIDVTIGENAEIFNNPHNVAAGWNSHAEGENTKAIGNCSHAEGNGTEATGVFSHAEGATTQATSTASHAEGNSTLASGYYSHAEGSATTASGRISHAEGDGSEALEWASHAEGCLTIAASPKQHTQGQYNIVDSESKYAHIVGNGTSYNRRSNAHTLDWSGNAWFAGNVKVGGTSQDDATAKTLATTEYVDNQINFISTQSVLPKMTTITLEANAWTGSSNPWSQVVSINGVTVNSKIDLQPTAVQIVELQNADIMLMIENNGGTTTAYAIGGKPTVDYTMQVLITEVTPV